MFKKKFLCMFYVELPYYAAAAYTPVSPTPSPPKPNDLTPTCTWRHHHNPSTEAAAQLEPWWQWQPHATSTPVSTLQPLPLLPNAAGPSAFSDTDSVFINDSHGLTFMSAMAVIENAILEISTALRAIEAKRFTLQ